MKKIGILGAIAGAAAVVAIVYYRRDDVAKFTDNLMGAARNLGGKLKDRLLHNVHGPNGEPVYVDMYDRRFYENEAGERVYLENV